MFSAFVAQYSLKGWGPSQNLRNIYSLHLSTAMPQWHTTIYNRTQGTRQMSQIFLKHERILHITPVYSNITECSNTCFLIIPDIKNHSDKAYPAPLSLFWVLMMFLINRRTVFLYIKGPQVLSSFIKRVYVTKYEKYTTVSMQIVHWAFASVTIEVN